jgi:hypothetical protein
MPAHERYTKEEIADALTKCHGLIHLTAQRLGCTKETIRLYRQRYPELEEILRESRGLLVDAAEHAVYRAVLNGERWAVVLVLEAFGGDRGYGKTEKTRRQIAEEEVAAKLGIPDNDQALEDLAAMVAMVKVIPQSEAIVTDSPADATSGGDQGEAPSPGGWSIDPSGSSLGIAELPD